MPAAVPAIPPKPKIAAMIAITRNVNAQLSMIKRSVRVGTTQSGLCPTRRAKLTQPSGCSCTLCDYGSRFIERPGFTPPKVAFAFEDSQLVSTLYLEIEVEDAARSRDF